jgi:hypothetical protein
MDSYEKNTHKLKALWGDDDDRQGAKIVILQAIASTSELSAKVTLDILDELDRLLLPEPVEEKNQKNRGL